MIQTRWFGLFGVMGWTLLSLVACSDLERAAYARVITSPDDLLDGAAAGGDLGDIVLANDRIQVVISRRRPSRTVLPMTGAIIDAVPMSGGDEGGVWHDGLLGLFPLALVTGFDPGEEADVFVVASGGGGEAAVVRANARPRALARALETLGGALLAAEGVALRTDYILRPGATHVEIRSELLNEGSQPLSLDGSVLRRQLDVVGGADGSVEIAFGDALITAGDTRMFVPGDVPAREGRRPVGFDVVGGDRSARAMVAPLPALPGMLSELIAAVGPGVSYGLAPVDVGANTVERNRALYTQRGLSIPSRTPMVVSMASREAVAVHYSAPPTRLLPGEGFEWVRRFFVGRGDVDTVREELLRVRSEPVGELIGEVGDTLGGRVVADSVVHILDGGLRPYSTAKVDELGRFRATLPAGSYFLRVSAPGAPATPLEVARRSGVEIVTGQSVYRRLAVTAPASLSVRVRDSTGRSIPAKLSVVGAVSGPTGDPIDELALGDDQRARSSVGPASAADAPQEYVEAVAYRGEEDIRALVRPTGCRGLAGCEQGQRATSYRLVVSRGPEYSLAEIPGVVVGPGESRSFDVVLERRIDTEGYLAVDFDLKGGASPEGIWSGAERARAAAAEGIEVYWATDVNRSRSSTTEPIAASVSDWVVGLNGVELSSVESGDVVVVPAENNRGLTNGLPSREECVLVSGADTLGVALDGTECSAAERLLGARGLGTRAPELTVVIASHPRRGTRGLFNQLSVNGLGEPTVPTFLNDRWRGWPLSPEYRGQGLAPDGLNLNRLDAMMVWHGKATPTLRDFRPPRAETLDPSDANDVLLDLRNYQCADGHPNNALDGTVFFEGGDIRFPGPLSDFDRQLQQGRALVALGASGASGRPGQEAGAPRSYVWVGSDDERGIIDRRISTVTDADVLNGIFQRRVLVTNGPFLDIRVRTDNADGDGVILWPVGSFISFSAPPDPEQGATVVVLVRLRSPPWMRVETVRVLVNGETVESLLVPNRERSDGNPIDDEWLFPVELSLFEDSFITAEAEGSESLFPVVTPFDSPRSGIDGALRAIAEAFGLPDVYARGDGLRAPNPVRNARPFAFTNPILLDVDGSGAYRGPGVAELPPPAPVVPCPPGLE
ncbi:MAG: hypothetical protein AAFP04_10665 [Myxococcota bacterium]